jgi:gas vesicle protein
MTYDYDRFESEDRGGAFLMGLLAGTVLGAGLGMLFAPKSGNELRHQLGDSANRLQRTATETYHQASDRVNEIVQKGRETYDHLVHRGREAIERGREAYEETRKVAREQSGTSAGAS